MWKVSHRSPWYVSLYAIAVVGEGSEGTYGDSNDQTSSTQFGATRAQCLSTTATWANLRQRLESVEIGMRAVSNKCSVRGSLSCPTDVPYR
jgi:hypothetical protein